MQILSHCTRGPHRTDPPIQIQHLVCALPLLSGKHDTSAILSSACQTNGPCGIQEDVCLPAEEHELVAHLALH